MVFLPNIFIPKRKHFGLSIGRTSLRAVELDNLGKVKLLVEMQLPPDVFDKGVLVKKDFFRDSLKKLIVAGKFTTSYVAVCFSEVYAYSREYALPIISTEDIYEAVNYHVRDLFPFPEEELYFDWKILETKEKEYRIAVVAVQKKIIDPLVEVLQEIKLKPLGFEPGASAIARLLSLKSNQHVLVTEVNKQGAYVTLVEDEKSLFTTIVNYTAQDNLESYNNLINQTIKEIAEYYQKKGILKNEQIKIILTGELASEKLAQQITTGTNFPTQILVTQVGNPSFNKAYAVAFSKVTPPYDPLTINLLPVSLQQYYDKERNRIFYQSLILRSIIITAVFFIISLSAFLGLSIFSQNLNKNVKELTTSINNQEGKTQNLLLLNAQSQNIVTLAPLRKTPKDKLLIIKNILPENIFLNQWEYDDGKQMFVLNGTAKSRQELLEFKTKLEETDEFIKVTLPLGSLETPENIKFTISFVINK